eukprot:GHVP01045990.1.p1 GENE.GHVP01045990.1~~GHVP01045990.1.p1  ORF type:complete len:103 (+),score=16.83 GHVP01045990.1:79-387(+)
MHNNGLLNLLGRQRVFLPSPCFLNTLDSKRQVFDFKTKNRNNLIQIEILEFWDKYLSIKAPSKKHLSVLGFDTSVSIKEDETKQNFSKKFGYTFVTEDSNMM